MKKILMLVVVAVLIGVTAGCMSARTPTSGPNNKNVYYHTFFGISLESAVSGDGLIVK